MTQLQCVKLEKHNGISWIYLNRPEKRNAMSPQLHAEMEQTLEELEVDPDTKVVVIAGAGGNFSAGQDLKMFFRENEGNPIGRKRSQRTANRWRWELLYNYDKPTIAMVQGYCVGGAFMQLLGCDFAIAADNATFSLSEVNWGILPGALVSKVVADALLPRHAMYYACLGDAFDGKEAERIGLGCVWISERYALKEPAVLAGAVAEATSKIRITGTMYATMRHPLVTASVADMMQAMSGERFRMMFARAVPAYMKMLGSPPITMERLADLISICRRLWAGEKVDYEGVLGKFPAISLTDRHGGTPPPIIFTAIGPKSLEFAGEHCDGVLLHPFVSAQGVKNSAKIVRDAAEKAGRDPMSVRIYHNIIVAPDLPKDEEEAVVGGRAITYFELPGFGDLIVDINGWDKKVLEDIRAHPKIASLNGKPADQAYTRQELVDVSRLIPQEWLDQGAAVGTAAQCADQLMDFLDAGADEILLHGSSPKDMGPLVTELKRALAAKGL